jgi:hypothetical protein
MYDYRTTLKKRIDFLYGGNSRQLVPKLPVRHYFKRVRIKNMENKILTSEPFLGANILTIARKNTPRKYVIVSGENQIGEFTYETVIVDFGRKNILLPVESPLSLEKFITTYSPSEAHQWSIKKGKEMEYFLEISSGYPKTFPLCLGEDIGAPKLNFINKLRFFLCREDMIFLSNNWETLFKDCFDENDKTSIQVGSQIASEKRKKHAIIGDILLQHCRAFYDITHLFIVKPGRILDSNFVNHINHGENMYDLISATVSTEPEGFNEIEEEDEEHKFFESLDEEEDHWERFGTE